MKKTIEQKAKAYDEAIARAKAMIKVAANQDEAIYFANTIFPKFKEEPEDEKIRKELIKWIEEFPDSIWRGHYTKDVIAWLEKQGEQKSYGQREECVDCQFNYAGECKGSCAMKRSERKPADKVEPLDEFAGLTDFERILADICIGWIGKEIGWKQYIKDNADALLQIAVEKFNSVQDAPFEQKAAWSKNDEVRIEQICEDLKCGLENFRSGKNVKGLHFEEIIKSNIDFLKSLKQRIGG